MNMLSDGVLRLPTNELVQVATLSKGEIGSVTEPFAQLKDLLHPPLYTYPFFGEDEELQLETASVHDTLKHHQLVPSDLAIVLVVCRQWARAPHATSSGHYYLASNCEQVLAPACRLIAEKLAEFAGDAGVSLQRYADWAEYKARVEEEYGEGGVVDSVVDSVTCEDGYELVCLEEDRERQSPLFTTLQVLLPFYIEAAVFIDTRDTQWTVHLLVDKTSCLVEGFLTAYRYFRFPEGCKQRISQVLVMPARRNTGVGRTLYNQVVGAWQGDAEVKEIGVEAPTDVFERLRAVNDWLACQRGGVWSRVPETRWREVLSASGGPYKYSPAHASRLINLHLYHQLICTPPEPKKKRPSSTDHFRVRCKKTLLARFSADLPEDALQRKAKLAELYQVELEEFLQPVSDALRGIDRLQ